MLPALSDPHLWVQAGALVVGLISAVAHYRDATRAKRVRKPATPKAGSEKQPDLNGL